MADSLNLEGPFVDGKMHGYWVIRWPDGTRFEGEMRDNKANGFGTITYSGGETFEGDWREGCFQGRTDIVVGTTMEACGFE